MTCGACRRDSAKAIGSVLAFFETCAADGTAADMMATLKVRILRERGAHAEALDLVETYPFRDATSYIHALAVTANVYQDLDESDRAEAAYKDALAVGGEPPEVARAYGVFLFREGRFAEGVPSFSHRVGPQSRRLIAEANAEAEALVSRDRIFLISEQGVGDQVALLKLLDAAPIDPLRQEIYYVGEPRLAPLLARARFPMTLVPVDGFMTRINGLDPRELVYLGDLSRHLQHWPAELGGAFFTPEPERRAALRARYEALAAGRPIYGAAWWTSNPLGHLRAVPLRDLLGAIPEGAMVVSLQYGRQEEEIAAAQAARPDLLLHVDDAVDQFRDLEAFAAQIAALDTVVSIDNTTLHLAGALGHGDAHALIPAGSESMWYWGRDVTTDPWYGNLALHRQERFGDWSGALHGLRQSLLGQRGGTGSVPLTKA